jgi:probable addiction module antidote protein
MTLKTLPWDAADHLDSDEAAAAYLNAAFDDGDAALIAAALGDVARARGMSRVAREVGASREGLYRSLSRNGNPELATVIKITQAMGLKLSVARIGGRRAAAQKPGAKAGKRTRRAAAAP